MMNVVTSGVFGFKQFAPKHATRGYISWKTPKRGADLDIPIREPGATDSGKRQIKVKVCAPYRQFTNAAAVSAAHKGRNGGRKMYGSVAFILMMMMGLLSGSSWAGESDLMAMRGDAGDGKTHVNYFQASWRLERDAEIGRAPLPEQPAGHAPPYMEWRNSCVFVPMLAVPAAQDFERQDGFDHVSPFVIKPPKGEGYIDKLAGELTGG